MRYTLKNYQSEAVGQVLINLKKARDSYHRYRSRVQFSLSATTGAGKTVMAAAIIEALFFGNTEFDFAADPGAVVLWFSDDPSLNEQSRARIQAAASELDGRLRVVQSSFCEPYFLPRNVYFLNTQKLSKNSRLVRSASDSDADNMLPIRPDMLQASIYDTIANTISDPDLTLYFILDEAHRGMGNASRDRATIVQNLINGGVQMPPLPIVFGISATVERFQAAMKHAQNRDSLSSVVVAPERVQASGLLKDDIILDIPAEKGVFDTVLLTKAVQSIKRSSDAWLEYARQQGLSEPVDPLLVIQVEDKVTKETLVRVLDTVYREWPELADDAVANVFGEHTDLEVGPRLVPYVEPQRVQDSRHIRVLLAKSAISTGWDCPRAEVLVSFRPARDRTHITQLLGRMVRTPLARRVPGNEILNSVHCLLPKFEHKTAVTVADELLTGPSGKGLDLPGGPGRRVLFAPVELSPNPVIDLAVWEKFVALPSQTMPRMDVRAIPRLTKLAAALARDRLVEGAIEQTKQRLCRAMDGLALEYGEQMKQADWDVRHMEGEEIRIQLGGLTSQRSFAISSDPRAIDEYYRVAERVFSPLLCGAYVDYLLEAGQQSDLLEARIRVAALARVDKIAEAVESRAEELAREWLESTRVARKSLSDERQAEYDEIEARSKYPERITLAAPVKAQADTKVRNPDGSQQELPVYPLHLMCAAGGGYPADLNNWERKVLECEQSQRGFKGWYRNPSRGLRESLAVAYQDQGGTWKVFHPDFIFFSEQSGGQIAADLVDPHSHHLADALPKLIGLANFAERFADDFRRIEAVTEVNGRLRVLDLTRAEVRTAIRAAAGQTVLSLYKSELASDYY